MTRLLLLGGLVITTQVFAAGARVTVLPFKGPKATSPRAQIYFPLCEQAECIAVDKAVSRGKPDLAKARKNKIEGLISGTVAKVKKKMTLDLKMVSAKGEVLYKKSFPLLPNGKLSPKQVTQAKEGLLSAVGGDGAGGGDSEEEDTGSAAVAERSSPAAREEETKAEPEETEAPTRTASRDTSSASEEEDSSARRRRSRDSEVEASDSSAGELSEKMERPSKPRKAPAFSVQVGTEIFGPSLTWTGVGTSNLRKYSSPAVIAPRFRAEFYPLALFSDVATGLGLELDYMFSVGSRTRKANDTVVYPTNTNRFDFALRYRINPIAKSRFAITPFAGYRAASFSVGKGADGSVLDGLPNISYSALRLGAAFDFPLTEALTLSADGAFLPVLSTGQLGNAYFPGGTSATGLEFGAGLGYAFGGFEVRVLAHYTRYSMSFKTTADSIFVASGAADQQFGGGLALRYTY